MLHSTPSTQPLRVLVADDDDDMRALVAETLRADGCTTQEAQDGTELIEVLRLALDDPGLRPDVLVTDLRMPGVSGLGVLEALREAHWSLPVVMMTAATDPSIQEGARRLGALCVLTKPFDPDDLLSAVHHAKAAGDLRTPPRD